MSLLTSSRPNYPKNYPIYWVLLFSLIGFGLRLHNLSFQPLWGDEGWSFYLAVQPLSQLLALTAIDIHPPFYYILLKAWFSIIGVGSEEARFFSVIAGTMLIPTLHVLGRRLFDDRAGVAGAAVVSVMPMAIYYSQEVRMYGLVTLLGAMSVYFFIKRLDDSRYLWSIAYIVTTAMALYTHYYAALIVLAQLLYTFLTHLKSRGWERRFLSGLAPFIYAGLLYLPWFIYLGPRLLNYLKNKREVEGYLPLDFIRFFGDHLVAFSVGHLFDNLQQYVWTALAFMVVASLGFIAVLISNRHRCYILLLYLFAPLLTGYFVNLAYPFTPRFFERTLLLAAPAYWLLIAAGIIWLWDRQYILVGTVVLALLLITGVSLISFYTIPRYPQEDYRPLLKDIAARATPEDTLLVSYQWQFGFYHAYLPPPRPRLFSVPGWGKGWAEAAGYPQLTQDLTHIFETSPRLWFPTHQALGHSWEDEAEAAIADLGYPALLEWYGPQTKLTLAGAASTTFTEAPTTNFTNRLTLLTARVGNEKYEAGRGIVPVELIWRKEKSLGSDHRVSLRLADAEGRTWAIRDSQPRAGQIFFTDLTLGDTLTDRHGLLVPAGTPPGLYRLLLSVRRVHDAHPLDLLDAEGQPLGVESLLAQIEVIDPNPNVDPTALPVQIATGAAFGQEAQLVGYSLGPGSFKAGQALPLTLFWQSLTDQPGPLIVSVQLQDASGQTVFSHQKEPIRPTTDWQHGTLLRDPQDLPLPPALPPGDYRLVVGLSTPEQIPLEVSGNHQLPLTTVTTIDRPHLFEPPDPQIELTVIFGDQARLAGLDLPQPQIKAGEQLSLTLHWQAITTFDKSWKVFVHLLDDEGRIVAQKDQIPGGGQFPTTGWLPDEYLTDSYNLAIPADTPPGHEAYRLEIGLYDPNDSSIRLPVIEEGEIINDHLILESWPISVE